MKKLYLELWRDILRTRTRYLSILLIVALGTGFFAGVKVTCPAMLETANRFYQDANLLDFRLMCNYGLTDDDIEATRNFDGVRQVEAGYSKDVFVGSGAGNEAIAKVLSLSSGDISRLELLEGRFPEAENECLVERATGTPTWFVPGAEIHLTADGDEDLSDTFTTDRYTIVGVIRCPNYIGLERGNTNIGRGTIDTVVYVPETAFALEVYTDLYVTLDETQGLDAYSDEYKAIIDHYYDEFEEFGKERAALRHDEIMAEANDALEEARQELADGEREAEEKLAEAYIELTDAEAEIADGEKEIADAELEIADGWEELATQRADAEKELADAEYEIIDGWRQLEDGKKEYLDGEKEYLEGLETYHREITDAEDTLLLAKLQLDEGFAQLEQARLELQNGQQQYETGLRELDANAAQLDAQRSETMNQIADGEQQIESGLAQIAAARQQYGDAIPPTIAAMLDAQEQELNAKKQELAVQKATAQAQFAAAEAAIEAGRAELAGAKQQLDMGWNEYRTGKAQMDDAQLQYAIGLEELETEKLDAQKEFDDARAKLDEAKQEIEENEQKLKDAQIELADARVTLATELQDAEQKLRDAEQELQDAKVELADGKKELADGWKEYEEKKQEVEEELLDAKRKLRDAEDDIRELDEGKFYVFTREDYPGYEDFATDAERVDNVAKVFPIFFILIAILVCLTNMTRMVDEQRTQLGTMKALGYTNGAIISKYMIYALSATIFGCIAGLSVGFVLFPTIIFKAYGIMYTLPDVIIRVHWDYVILCTVVSALSTGGATYMACRKDLVMAPAQLMRPAAPKIGKKILLERIPLLWNRLSFTYKITLRNIFRYKKRMLMTVVGISGCTALMLTGFGLDHAISAIVPRQFEDIFLYDGIIVLENDLLDEESTAVIAEIEAIDGVSGAMRNLQMTVDVIGDDRMSATVLVPHHDAPIADFVSLHDRVTKTPLTLDDTGVIINEKLAKRNGIAVGETIELTKDGEHFTVPVSGVTENYTMNYIYMTDAMYTATFGGEPEYNMLLVEVDDSADTEAIAEQVIDTDHVLGMQYQYDTAQKLNDLVDTLGFIVIVVILSAGLLAFIVLYNLVNVNVAERIRELATIKVLGFYDKETTSYITRETSITTVIGVGVGLLLGIALEKFVVAMAEVDAVMFAPDISPDCFIWAAVLTFVFTLIVNFTLHFSLKKIDMVESLKSIE